MAKVRTAGETNLFKWVGFGGRGRKIPWIPRPAPPFKWLPKQHSDYKVSWVPSVPTPYAPVKNYEPSYITTRRFDHHRPANFLMKFSRNNINSGLTPPTYTYDSAPPKDFQSNTFNRDFSKHKSPVRQNSKVRNFELEGFPPQRPTFQRDSHKRNFETQFKLVPPPPYETFNKVQEQNFGNNLETEKNLVETGNTESHGDNQIAEILPVKQRLTSKLMKTEDVIYIDRGDGREFLDFDEEDQRENELNFVVSEKFSFADADSKVPNPTKRSEGSRGFWKSKIVPVPLFSKSDLSTFPLFS